jgi:hypothetical protein
VRNKRKATALVLIALFVTATGVSRAAPKAPRRVAKPSVRPKPSTTTTTMLARPCGATTLPALPLDGLAFAQDIDRDGALDLTVTNPVRREFRVAFSAGPEVTIPLPDAAGGKIYLATYRVPWDPKAFALLWIMTSSGFYVQTVTVFRRDGCLLTKLPFPSEPPTIVTSVSRSFMSIGASKGIVDAGLRCDGEDIFRVRHMTTWSSYSIFTTTVWKWQYSYTPAGFGLLKAFDVETQTHDSDNYVPIGRDCFTDRLSLLI